MKVALAVVASLVIIASAAAAAQTTRVKVYQPFDGGNLAMKMHFTSKTNGQCSGGSKVDSRSNAWRCTVGKRVLDPCFSHPLAHSWVACPSAGNPFGLGVIRVKLSKPLPRALSNHGAPGQGNPWAIKLLGGRVCTYVTGGSSLFHGQRVNYSCPRGAFLAGSPDRSTPTWTITLATSRSAPPQSAVILSAAW